MTGSGIADGAVDGLLVDSQGTSRPMAVRDQSTGVIVFYPRLESGQSNIYAQHMLNVPFLRLTLPGRRRTRRQHAKRRSPITTAVSDGAGGAISVGGYA
jgi:hypothetical protein